MTIENISSLIREYWPKNVELLRELIRAHPTYENIEGLEKASSLISSFLESFGIVPIVINYTNAEFCDHSSYVPVEDFGSVFSNDRNRKKKNIIAVVDSGKPGRTLILNGHYDVDFVNTPDQWSAVEGWRCASVVEDRLYGRGASDMLGGLCVLLLVVCILHKEKDKWCGRIVLTAVCDEEIGGNGTLKSLLWLKERGVIEGEICGLIAEPSDRKVCRESLGFFHIKLEAKRRSAHMGIAKESNNALYDIIKIVQTFPTLVKNAYKLQGGTLDKDKIIFNWGIIAGGADAAIPLGQVHLEGVVFLPETLDSQQFQERLIQEISSASDSIVKAEFSSFNFQGAFSDEGFIYKFLLDEECLPAGYFVSSGLFPSPCDARLFKDFAIPVTIYGPGSLSKAHAIDEYVSLKELENYAEHCLRAVWRAMHD